MKIINARKDSPEKEHGESVLSSSSSTEKVGLHINVNLIKVFECLFHKKYLINFKRERILQKYVKVIG